MARFYAEIKGNKSMASRIGTKDSGIWAHIRGWNIGVEIQCYVNEEGKDCIRVQQTGGSNSSYVENDEYFEIVQK